MSLPRVIVEVGLTGPEVDPALLVLGDEVRGLLGTGELGSDADEIWTDISEYVRSWSVRRGSSRGDDPTLRYDTGTCSVQLNDGDRRFDPDNLAGPYVLSGVSLLTPMRRIRIRAEYGDVSYPIFRGFTDDWVAEYQGNDWTYVTVSGSDPLSWLSGVDREAVAAVGAGEDSGARVTRILNALGWSAEDRAIAAGDSTLQATTLEGSALTELLLVQDSELGEFYSDAQGRMVFRNRQAIITEDRSTTAQAVFGDGGYLVPVLHDFEIGVADWFPFFSTVSQSTAIVYSGGSALLFTVVGSPAQSYARTTYGTAVHEGDEYAASMWVYSPAGDDVGTAIDWFDASLTYLSTSYSQVTVPAATWTSVSVTGTAPAGAARATYGPTLPDSPAGGTQLYLDNVTLEATHPEIPYSDAKPSSLVESLVNTVYASIDGGTTQTAQDAESAAQYLVRTHRRLDLILEPDDEALLWANAVKYQFATPRRRWESLELITPAPQVAPAHWPAVLGREFGDRITVIRRPAGGGDAITRDCFIRGISHVSDGQSWTVTMTLQSADRYSFFVLGDAILGVLGENALAY